MALVDPFQDFKVSPHLALEFVAVFARCEYAMKQENYRRDARAIAAAAWHALAADAGKWLTVPPGTPLAAAVQLLSATPPKLQTYSGAWRDGAPPGDNPVEKTLNSAGQVRHNLFHGGKHHPQRASATPGLSSPRSYW